MSDDLHVTLTAIVGDTLWGVDTTNGRAVVWDQRLTRFRLPTQQEQMGAEAYNHRRARISEAFERATKP